MTDPDRCAQTYPHPAHRRFGLKDCPGVPITPANAPTVPDGPAPASTLPGTVRGVGIAFQRLGMRVGEQLRDFERRLGQLEDRVDEHLTPSEYDPADDEDAQAAVQNLLDDSTRAFAAADTSSKRVEVIRDLLAGWYAAWPSTAVTDEHEGIAHQIVALVYAAEARVSPPSSVPPRRAQEPGAWMNRRAVVSDALGRALTARGYDVPLPVRDRCAEAVLAAQDVAPAEREG